MNTQRLAQLSQRMSLLTLLLIVVMLVLNTGVWLFRCWVLPPMAWASAFP